jgi:hypothetical protein
MAKDQNRMQRNLKHFLDLLPPESLERCSVEFTYDKLQRLTRPKYSTQQFQTINDLEEHLALTFAKDEVTILSLQFEYTEQKFLRLDLLMNNLYMRNSATLVSLEKLLSVNLIGKGKLIDEILVKFCDPNEAHCS